MIIVCVPEKCLLYGGAGHAQNAPWRVTFISVLNCHVKRHDIQYGSPMVSCYGTMGNQFTVSLIGFQMR